MILRCGMASIDAVDEFVDQLDTIGDTYGCTVQAFDARYVASSEHLRAALEHADRAIERDEAIARDRGVEILLYAAGRRQINRALEMGVSPGERPVVVLIAGETDEADESVAAEAVETLLADERSIAACRDEARIREFFDITDDELAATTATLAELVIERVALLVVER
ncbi:MAG: KEOPS complex subunit Cgi121 [Halobacteriales archaeon]